MERILADIDAALKSKDAKREKVIAFSREIIRRSGSAVLAVHKQDEAAKALNLKEAQAALEGALEICREQQEFYFTGPMPQAFQEFAEAWIVASFAEKKDLPNPAELKVPVESYLTGLADAAGEMRRYALDSLRRDEFEEAGRALASMEEIYTALKGFDFPRAVIPNLRRKVDIIRRLLEETRGDVTLAHQGMLIRGSIEKALER